ncbi:MAG TPA: FG-GAP-like repeat-containing protein [Edaphobacter sp.]|nr:FG-GAP-like repeat-containing protein [Edaphobacter sp.]
MIRRFIKTVALCSLSLMSMAAAPRQVNAQQVKAQQFNQPLVIPTGSWPAGIVAADLKGDGRADLIYTDYGATATASTTHVLLNNGNGTFTPGQTIATAGATMAAADFDHDGHVDLVWVWGTVGLGKVYLARGNGDGTFAAAQQLGTFAIVGTNAPDFRYVMGAQLHDTGYLDVLVEDVANPSLLTLTTDSSGTLVRIVGTKLQSGTGPMVAADLNGDGHTDLVIQSALGGAASDGAASGGTVNVFFGSADGLLVAAGTYAGSSAVESMLLHDVDGDGHLDLVLEGANGRIEILHGNPDGSFAATSEGGSGSADATTGVGGHLVAVTDAGGRHNFYTATPAGMSVLLEQSDLSLTLEGIYNAGPGRDSFAVADFNGDGVLDVAVDSPEGVAILFGSAGGGLGSSRAFAAGKPALSGALGDFSGSGNLDAVVDVAAAQALLLHGNGDGTFAALATPTAMKGTASPAAVTPVGNLPGAPQIAGMVAEAPVMADLDGDGNQDVVVAYDNASADHAHPVVAAANAIYVWYGKADGTYAAPVVLTPSRNFYQVAVVDVNGDGRPDLVMSDGYVVSVQNNLGGRASGAEQHYVAGMGINSISAGDVNKDGRTDLVIANGGAVISNPASGQTAAKTEVNTGGITVLLNQLTLVPTTVVLTITSPLTITFGQAVNGAAQVTASDGSLATGTISFYDGATNICTIPVAPSASCPASAGANFAVGTHVLTAVYSGDTTHLGSTSAPVTVTVLPVAATKAQTVTMLTSSVDPAASGQSVTFTANVVAAAGSVAAPTGVVTFLDGGTVLGTKTLVGSGVGSFSISSLSVGVHAITASYAGDANSVASVSAVLTETVNGAVAAGSGFSVSVTGAAKVGVGGVASLQVAVAPQTGYMQPVQLSCGDLPSEAACIFAAHMIPAGGGTTTLQLSTMAPRSCAVADSGSTTAGLPFVGTTVAALIVLFIPGRRRRAVKGLLVALVALCGMATLSGCGACTDLGTKPGSYTIRVIGTSGASVVTTKVQVTVTTE